MKKVLLNFLENSCVNHHVAMVIGAVCITMLGATNAYAQNIFSSQVTPQELKINLVENVVKHSSLKDDIKSFSKIWNFQTSELKEHPDILQIQQSNNLTLKSSLEKVFLVVPSENEIIETILKKMKENFSLQELKSLDLFLTDKLTQRIIQAEASGAKDSSSEGLAGYILDSDTALLPTDQRIKSVSETNQKLKILEQIVSILHSMALGVNEGIMGSSMPTDVSVALKKRYFLMYKPIIDLNALYVYRDFTDAEMATYHQALKSPKMKLILARYSRIVTTTLIGYYYRFSKHVGQELKGILEHSDLQGSSPVDRGQAKLDNDSVQKSGDSSHADSVEVKK